MPPAQAHQAENCFSAASRASIILTAELTTNQHLPEVLITDLKVFNRSAVPGNIRPLKTDFHCQRNKAGLRAKLALSFVALNYTTPGQNHYAYMLEGLIRNGFTQAL